MILLAALAMLSSCDSSSDDSEVNGPAYSQHSTESNDAAPDVGQPSSSADQIVHQTASQHFLVQILETETIAEFDGRQSDAGLFVNVRVRIQNLAESSYAFVDSQFALKTKDGYTMNPKRFARDPDLGGSGILGRGLAREGWITFEIKSDQAPDQLKFSTDIIGGEEYFLQL